MDLLGRLFSHLVVVTAILKIENFMLSLCRISFALIYNLKIAQTFLKSAILRENHKSKQITQV